MENYLIKPNTAAQSEELEAARRKAAADEKEDLVNKAHALLMLGMGQSRSLQRPPAPRAQARRSPGLRTASRGEKHIHFGG